MSLSTLLGSLDCTVIHISIPGPSNRPYFWGLSVCWLIWQIHINEKCSILRLVLYSYLWKCVRLQSIESFAVTVKEIAQLLQGFGSELSDTELPDEANAIEFLLHSHTHRYRQMKVDAHSSLSMSPFLAVFLCVSFLLKSHLTLCFRTTSGVCWKKGACCCPTWKLSRPLRETWRRRGKYK